MILVQFLDLHPISDPKSPDLSGSLRNEDTMMIPLSSFPKGPKAIYSDDCTLGKGNEYHTLGEVLDTVSELTSVSREINAIMAFPV